MGGAGKVLDFMNCLAPIAAAGLLVSGCTAPAKSVGQGYDPCSEMRTEGDRVARLDVEIRRIHAWIAEANRAGDTTKTSSLRWKLTEREKARASEQQAMQRAGEACDAEMRSLNRYREPPSTSNEAR